MARYDYTCTACAHVFEVVHSMTETPAIDCPTCGALAERRISGGAGLVFKGGGFYVTDSRPSASSTPSADSGPACAGESYASGCGNGACQQNTHSHG